MSQRTVILSSFEEYLACENYAPEIKADEERGRVERLSRFPYAVTLQVSYPELNFANRWCWQRFGSSDGNCLEGQSEYPACNILEIHSHTGKWMWCWLAKTDYNFGFCEWYFSNELERDYFLASVGEISWGEKYT